MTSRTGRHVALAVCAGAAFVALSALAGAGPVKGGAYAGLLKGDRTSDESVVFQVSSNGKKAVGINGTFAEGNVDGCDRDGDRGETSGKDAKAPIEDNKFKKKLDLFDHRTPGPAVGTVKIAVEFKGNGDGKGTVKVRYSDPNACDYDDKFLADAG